MVKNIVLHYEEKDFKRISRIKAQIKKLSGMSVFSWENFFLDQIINNN